MNFYRRFWCKFYFGLKDVGDRIDKIIVINVVVEG